MTRKASFSVEISTQYSTAHNNRSEPPKYLLGLKANTQNYYAKLNGYDNDSSFISLMSQKYQNTFGQKMQQKQKNNMIKEAVISLKEHHNKDDILSLFTVLEEVFGGHIALELSIHRDEGHYERDGIPYYPSKHIVQKTDGWYTISDDQNHDYNDDDEFQFPSDLFNNPVNISEFTPIYNYHAHVKFTMINMRGITPSFEKNESQKDEDELIKITERDKMRTAKMEKRMMQARLKIVAKELNMRYAPNPKTSRVKKSISNAKESHETQRQRDILCQKHKQEIQELEQALDEQRENKVTLSSKIIEYEDFMDEYEDLLDNKSKHIVKLKNKLKFKIGELTDTKEELSVEKEYSSELEDLAFIKSENGNFVTYEADDGEDYYKTFQEQNMELTNWKRTAVSFFKKVTNFIGLSTELEDASDELDDIINRKKNKDNIGIPKANDNSFGGFHR